MPTYRTKAAIANVWWLALDRVFTSYEEAKARGVISQGFPKLGDLQSRFPLAEFLDERTRFDQAIRELAVENYGQNHPSLSRAPRALWYLFQVKSGDLVVALEGTTVKGICRPMVDAANSYEFQPSFHYAQSVCRPADWIDWDATTFSPPPQAPAQGVLGVAGLRNQRAEVIEAWERYQDREGRAFDAGEAAPLQ